MPSPRDRGLLFTDLEGSTRLLREVGPARYRRLLGGYHRRVRSALLRHGGEEVMNAGDGFFAVFPSPPAAVAAALELQAPRSRLRVRIGIDSGTVEHQVTGGHIGEAIHRGARIAAAAHGGQILVSDAVVDTLEPGAAAIQELGFFRLKDFPDPERIYAIARKGSPAVTLPPRGLAPVSRLPVPITGLIGRGAELELVCKLLSEDARLVTLLGPGGVGKTRLAVAVAEALRNAYHDGVHFVELGDAVDSADFPSLVTDALNLRQPEREQPRLYGQLERWDALLVVDNLEQLAAADQLIAELLRIGPRLRVLATSRRRLAVPGEFVVELDVLPADAAVELFLERARAANPRLEVDGETRQAAQTVCESLDRLPLAIELAAARSSDFEAVTLAARIQAQPGELLLSAANAPQRQRSLDASFEWSYRLLSPGEQAAFRRLSVFAGSFAEDSAADVIEDARPLATLLALRDRSLLRRTGSGADIRWEMLKTLRLGGRRLLEDGGEIGAARSSLLGHFVRITSSLAPALASERRRSAIERLALDGPNLRAAMEHGRDTDAQAFLKVTASLGWYWYHRGRFTEGRGWLLAALERSGEDRAADVVAARTAAARLAYYQGDAQSAYSEARLAAAGATELAAEVLLGEALIVRALAACDIGRAGLPTARKAVAVVERTGDRWRTALAHFYQGVVAILEHRHAVARAPLERAERLFSELGDRWGLGGVYYYLGRISAGAGDLATGRKFTEEAVELLKDSGDRWREAVALRGLAAIVERQGGDTAGILEEAAQAARQLA